MVCHGAHVNLLSIEPLVANFYKIFMQILLCLIKKMHMKMSGAERQRFCADLSVLMCIQLVSFPISVLIASLALENKITVKSLI